MDFIAHWSGRTGLPAKQFVAWLGFSESKYFLWKHCYGQVYEHNSKIPRDHWLTDAEKQAIIGFHARYPDEGYRRLTFMMMDRDIVATSPATVYRVLSKAGLLGRRKVSPSSKGKGFQQPDAPHNHWHIDVSYINVCGTFYYLCSVLDGCSRYIVHWEIRESMTEPEIERILERAREKFPGVAPRIISDNGPQFIARDFKEYIRVTGMSHVRTSPYYPQSNGKIERWHKSLKSEAIRPETPLSIEDARRTVERFVRHYNEVRLHSAIGYITPKDRMEERQKLIWTERDQKLAAAREARKRVRAQLRQAAAVNTRPDAVQAGGQLC
jgi:transposase InsO family protein